MKLLFDENVSARLVRILALEFPESSSVTAVGLGGATDTVIWDHAAVHGYTIVTKDDDFRSMSLVRGAPPKVICLRVGNASTDRIAAVLRSALSVCEDLVSNPEATLLVLTMSVDSRNTP